MDQPSSGQILLLVAIALLTLGTARWLSVGGWQAPLKTARKDRQSAEYSKTLRIRGVPLDWTTKTTESFLAEHHPSSKLISLAVEIHGRSQTGTVTFQNILASPIALQTHPAWRIPLPKSPERPSHDEDVSLDDDFYGITTLFAPPPNDHKVDVVALFGLGGHAFGSFKERGGTHMWLRDSLPYNLTRENTDRPMARVMTYGYESAVSGSKSMQNLEDLATSFHNSLLALAIITLSKSQNEDDQRLLQAVYGIVFFGVPHDGMDVSSLIPMVGDGPNRFLIESINRINSQILSIQQRDFNMRRHKKSRVPPLTPPSDHTATKSRNQLPVTEPAVDNMDWEPTRISQAIHKANEKLKGKRAKWVGQEEIDRRKSEGRCLRCGRTGCRVNKCPLLPAKRPDSSNGTKVARSRPVLKAEVEDESEDQSPSEQSEDESLKE